MTDKKSRNQKFFTPRPGIREWIEEYARGLSAAGKGAPSVVINAAIYAFKQMPREEQVKWLGRVMFPDQPGAIEPVEEATSRKRKPKQRRKGRRPKLT